MGRRFLAGQKMDSSEKKGDERDVIKKWILIMGYENIIIIINIHELNKQLTWSGIVFIPRANINWQN